MCNHVQQRHFSLGSVPPPPNQQKRKNVKQNSQLFSPFSQYLLFIDGLARLHSSSSSPPTPTHLIQSHQQKCSKPQWQSHCGDRPKGQGFQSLRDVCVLSYIILSLRSKTSEMPLTLPAHLKLKMFSPTVTTVVNHGVWTLMHFCKLPCVFPLVCSQHDALLPSMLSFLTCASSSSPFSWSQSHRNCILSPISVCTQRKKQFVLLISSLACFFVLFILLALILPFFLSCCFGKGGQMTTIPGGNILMHM